MRKKKYQQTCPICGKEFLLIGKEQTEQITYCSKKCSDIGRKQRIENLDLDAAEQLVTTLLQITVLDYKKAEKRNDVEKIDEIETFIFSRSFSLLSDIDPVVFYNLLLDSCNE